VAFVLTHVPLSKLGNNHSASACETLARFENPKPRLTTEEKTGPAGNAHRGDDGVVPVAHELCGDRGTRRDRPRGFHRSPRPPPVRRATDTKSENWEAEEITGDQWPAPTERDGPPSWTVSQTVSGSNRPPKRRGERVPGDMGAAAAGVGRGVGSAPAGPCRHTVVVGGSPRGR